MAVYRLEMLPLHYRKPRKDSYDFLKTVIIGKSKYLALKAVTGHIATAHFVTTLLFPCGWGLGFCNHWGFWVGALGVYMIVVWVLGFGVREIIGSGKVLVAI